MLGEKINGIDVVATCIDKGVCVIVEAVSEVPVTIWVSVPGGIGVLVRPGPSGGSGLGSEISLKSCCTNA